MRCLIVEDDPTLSSQLARAMQGVIKSPLDYL